MAERKRKESPKIPAPSPPPGAAKTLSPEMRWYLDNFVTFSKALGRPPSVLEFATWVGRTSSPAHRALVELESKGYLKRNDQRRFVVAIP